MWFRSTHQFLLQPLAGAQPSAATAVDAQQQVVHRLKVEGEVHVWGPHVSEW